jgi:pyrimidine precursor biosynthesis enzyme
VALLEPNDPSDVTEIIGSGKVDMGFKAMIHTLAVRVLFRRSERPLLIPL